MRTIGDIFHSHEVLDAAGRHVGGTDKHGPNHRYGDAYAALFPDHERGAVALVMEVGVADGSSLLAWSEVFPNSLVVGLDIHPSARARGDRIEFHLGDATNHRDCERAAGDRAFDLIVEDATHVLSDTLRTLFYLWPRVAPGGLYVVEEWADIGNTWGNVLDLFPHASVVDARGPSGGSEPLVVLRKPL